jgi:hypothetical protein
MTIYNGYNGQSLPTMAVSTYNGHNGQSLSTLARALDVDLRAVTLARALDVDLRAVTLCVQSQKTYGMYK